MTPITTGGTPGQPVLRVAVIRQRYNPYGGAERFVERALRALTDEGAQVTLIARSWQGEVRDGYVQKICDPHYARLLGGRIARDRSFAACAQREMASGGYDITQAHERIPGCMIFRAGDGVHAAWLEHRARGRIGFGQRPAHADGLRALTGEYECSAHAVLHLFFPV